MRQGRAAGARRAAVRLLGWLGFWSASCCATSRRQQRRRVAGACLRVGRAATLLAVGSAPAPPSRRLAQLSAKTWAARGVVLSGKDRRPLRAGARKDRQRRLDNPAAAFQQSAVPGVCPICWCAERGEAAARHDTHRSLPSGAAKAAQAARLLALLSPGEPCRTPSRTSPPPPGVRGRSRQGERLCFSPHFFAAHLMRE
jgi:hypothetical protein